ncbi:hypothetical protein FHS43_006091 [Streptosporangium becharense]|uniref:Uncharacterized protein n=1 Tax=Streptosporangium becharense TaxID=1816182 RepID=A0A7W9II31_9ACTN|nr:hypothetical protein [Streptosporangium becharense]MBB5820820.1 hypothetical protein [Streptosporangium becharense]
MGAAEDASGCAHRALGALGGAERPLVITNGRSPGLPGWTFDVGGFCWDECYMTYAEECCVDRTVRGPFLKCWAVGRPATSVVRCAAPASPGGCVALIHRGQRSTKGRRRDSPLQISPTAALGTARLIAPGRDRDFRHTMRPTTRGQALSVLPPPLPPGRGGNCPSGGLMLVYRYTYGRRPGFPGVRSRRPLTGWGSRPVEEAHRDRFGLSLRSHWAGSAFKELDRFRAMELTGLFLYSQRFSSSLLGSFLHLRMFRHVVSG